jgi:hypothetical protein
MRRIPMHPDPEVAWLIGLVEGEGYFGCHSNGQMGYLGPRFSLSMTDEDVVLKARDILYRLVGGQRINVNREERAGGKHQDVYNLRLGGERSKILMRLVVPYMSERKRASIWQALHGVSTAKYKNLDLVSLLKIEKVA